MPSGQLLGIGGAKAMKLPVRMLNALPLYHCTPLLGAAILRMPREQPAVSIQIFSRVLIFAILGLMGLFENLRPDGFRPGVVRIQIIHKNGQRLRPIPELPWRSMPGIRLPYLDRGFARLHLPAAWTVAIAVALLKAESPCEPGYGLPQVLIVHMGQHGVDRHGTILRRHSRNSTLQTQRLDS